MTKHTTNTDNNQQDPNRSIALKWWNELDTVQAHELSLQYDVTLCTDSDKERMYLAEHPAPTPVEVQDDLPFSIKRRFIEAAKEYASHVNGGITINNPDKYKDFRAGQESGYEISKQEIERLSALNGELVKALEPLAELDLVGVNMSMEGNVIYQRNSTYINVGDVLKAKAVIQKNKQL